jgi:hypothetical protein
MMEAQQGSEMSHVYKFASENGDNMLKPSLSSCSLSAASFKARSPTTE